MKTEAKQYHGIEREQGFVRRYALNPNFTGGTITLPSGAKMDHRKFVTTQLWSYCVGRHGQFWREQGEPRRTVPPNIRNDEGEEGWWFPASWVADFAERFRKRAA